jgi:superfamily II DNA/RNA helicase
VNPLFQHLTVPDLWQREAVQHLRAGRDVVVHAPTGAGKTFIFETIHAELKGQAVFTVPTRALANDKLAEWKARGWDVGIATGDVARNLDARVVVATLETQRGRFLRREGPRLLVVDEYQMIGDPHRGVNYELALALAPQHTQLLLLSGSVANPKDMVAWLRRIGRDAVLISTEHRPVPLNEVDLETLPNRAPASVRGLWPRLIANALRADLGPVLMFAPRRNGAEELAQTLASQLPNEDPLVLSPEQEALVGPRLTKLLKARVSYHHSGLSYAARAGVVEPLAKNGQLRVVVATMGLAAGINFSMRSVVVTDTRYMARNFERQVQPDDLLQMFGRAGRRGLDETGYVLFTSRPPRLLDARPKQLRRATQLDWPTLVAVMRGAPADPFGAALELNRRLFTPQEIPLGVEHSRQTGARRCGIVVDMERARFARRGIVEIRNSRGEWEPQPASKNVPLGEAWILHEGQWRPALSVAKTLDAFGFGTLCKLEIPGRKVYGRELHLGTRRDGDLLLAPWLSEQIGVRKMSLHGLETEVLAKLPALAAVHSKRPASGRLCAIIPRDDRLFARLDFSGEKVSAFIDSAGKAIVAPETREGFPACCTGCDELPWCHSTGITTTPAWAWRRLGLIEPDGVPTRRGDIFSFFHHGEGLAIAAALEDESYPIEDLIFDLANLRAGPRFSGDESPFSGRLGALCQRVYQRADFDDYLTMGVPTEYGACASELVRDIIQNDAPRAKLQTEAVRQGDIERALIEWRSVLRHIALAPDYDWSRWRALRSAAAKFVDATDSQTIASLPPLTGAQRRR